MRFFKNFSQITFVTLFMLLLLTVGANRPEVSAQSSDSEAPVALFSDSSRALTRAATEGLARARTVTINEAHLGGADGPDLANGNGETLQLNLFDDTVLTVHLDKLNQNESGSYTWIGTVAGDALSSVILVVRDGSIYGSIQTSTIGEYAIQPLADGVHAVQQAGGNTILPEDDTHIDPDSENLPASRAVSSDDGSIIDVLVVYSDDVPVANAESYAELFIAYTNQAYENSEINQRVWLVDTEQYTYVETGDLDTDLDNITPGKPNGLNETPVLNPDVTPHRDETHADLVLFFVNDDGNAASSCAGLAWLQTTLSTNFENRGFSAMKACSFGSNVFAHELGHNMGSRHDWFMDDATTPASTAHGYIDTSNNFRTIMAYSNRCVALGISCDRVAHFSNPAVTFGGATTGIAGGTSSACSDDVDGGPNTGTDGDPNPAVECDADNASNFNAKAAITSRFRDSRLTWTGATSTDWADASNWVINEGAPSATTPGSRTPRSFDNVYIPGGLGQYPTISGGTTFARELTIDSGATLDMTGGTLIVGWRWEDSGGFNASAGTVQLSGPIGVDISSASAFQNIKIGTGSDTTAATLSSNINIDGDLTIGAGATLNPGSNSINLAGDWSEGDATGFISGTSTVIFDGAAQVVNKVTAVNVLNEPFTKADGESCCGSSHLPTGWTREQASGSGWLAGNLTGSGEAIRWNNSSDAWLFTTAQTLDSAVNYALSFNYKNFFSGSPTSYTIYIGASPNSSSMTTQLHQVSGVSSSSAATATTNFTVSTSGTYYVGIRNQQDSGSNYAVIDDILIAGSNALNFYDLQVASGETIFNELVSVRNNLQTDAGALSNDDAKANFGANDPTVEGAVTNNGQIVQVKDVNGVGTLVEFGRIKNAAGSTRYYGVDLTPTTAAFGSTTVAIEGNDTCDIPGEGSATNTVNRCYDISPATNGQPATIKYYFHNSEQNGQLFNSLNAWHWNSGSSAWDLLGFTNRLSSANGDASWNWVEASGVSSYSPFTLAESAVVTSAPTSIMLSNQVVTQPISLLILFVVAILLIATVRLVSRSRVNQRLDA